MLSDDSDYIFWFLVAPIVPLVIFLLMCTDMFITKNLKNIASAISSFLVSLIPAFLVFIVFGIVVWCGYKFLTSKKSSDLILQHKLDSVGIPSNLVAYILFVEKYKSDLPISIVEVSIGLKRYLLNIKKNSNELDAINYASTVFSEPEFVSAIGKLNVIVGDKAYLHRFKNNYSNPTDIESKTIYLPILNTLEEFIKLRSNYKGLIDKTEENDFNNLLTQDFSKITNFK